MDFLGGLVVGLIIGVTIGTIAASALMAAKRADRDYESELNGPRGSRVDRQG
jgi:uncharacterized membrane-anchored protein YhcB (DUF1043 family)